MDINRYGEWHKSMIEELVIDDSFVRRDILKCLDKWPQCWVVIEDWEGVIGVGVFTGEDKKVSMTLYIKPSRRREGLGTILLKVLEDKMRSVGIEEVVCDFNVNESERSFLHKNEYKHWFYSNLMSYTGAKLTLNNYDITNYNDNDYYECQRIFSEAFHRMRLSVGLESELGSPSDNQKRYYKENLDNIFVLRDNNKILGLAIVDGNEIDGVSVDIDKQGNGYGKELVSYSINKLINRDFDKINLWVVEGNTAKILYEKLGFKAERIHQFVSKSLN